jgi:hypothetical protein
MFRFRLRRAARTASYKASMASRCLSADDLSFANTRARLLSVDEASSSPTMGKGGGEGRRRGRRSGEEERGGGEGGRRTEEERGGRGEGRIEG